jgi:hypothetical protein
VASLGGGGMKGKGSGGVMTTTTTVFSTVLYFGSLLNITGFYLNHGPSNIQELSRKIQNKDLLNFYDENVP